MARPTARVLSLLELLQSGGVRTVAELADRLDVDERTVRRYVDHLLDPRRAGRVGARPLWRVPARLRNTACLRSCSATTRPSPCCSAWSRAAGPGWRRRRARRPRRRRPRSAGYCPSGSPCRLDAVLGSLAFTAAARRGTHPGHRGPALGRRRPAPSQADLDQVHRRRRPAQRTHPAPVRARHPLRPLVRDRRGSRHRRGPERSGSIASQTPGPCPARSSHPPDTTRRSTSSPDSPRPRTGTK